MQASARARAVTRVGYFPERDYKQTNTPREIDRAARACDPCPPFQGNATHNDQPAVPRTSQRQGGEREYWRRRLSNPTRNVAHAYPPGFSRLPPPPAASVRGPTLGAPSPSSPSGGQIRTVKSLWTFADDDKASTMFTVNAIRRF